ncbi:hypothetical protein PPACK8108_LOCUS15043, partial [Phakopsora pachyrhizi]
MCPQECANNAFMCPKECSKLFFYVLKRVPQTLFLCTPKSAANCSFMCPKECGKHCFYTPNLFIFFAFLAFPAFKVPCHVVPNILCTIQKFWLVEVKLCSPTNFFFFIYTVHIRKTFLVT